MFGSMPRSWMIASVSRLFAQRGYHVRALVRTPAQAEALAADGIEPAIGNLDVSMRGAGFRIGDQMGGDEFAALDARWPGGAFRFAPFGNVHAGNAFQRFQ